MYLGQYHQAALEYERLIYEHSDNDTLINAALISKSEALKLTGNYSRALATLERVNLFSITEETKPIFYQKKAVLQILSKQYTEAIFSLLVLKSIEPNNTNTDILLCIAYNYAEKWSKAADVFSRLDTQHILNPKVSDSILNLYTTIPELKSVERASFLSIIPGLGMIYANELGEGILSFFLNAVPLGLGAYAFVEGYYFTGFLGGAFALEKFNTGGRLRAEYLTKKYNYTTSLQYNSKLKSLLLQLLP